MRLERIVPKTLSLFRKASKVVTLEYGLFGSEHPSWEIIRPQQFYERYHDRTLERFDAVFTYSSVEHSGLGRYFESSNNLKSNTTFLIV